MKDYSKLKSGTDIRGIASDIFGSEITLTDSAVYDIAAAFACRLRDTLETSAPKIAVGHDSRISAPRIKATVLRALCDYGATVLDCGLCSTPAMFMTTIMQNTDGAISITASHHPADRNGLKFFVKSGGLDSGDITDLVRRAAELPAPTGGGNTKAIDFLSQYSARLRKIICDGLDSTESQKPLTGFHIVVDAGCGAGGFYATQVLAPLGANISGSRYLEPDGMFPAHPPNPEDPTAMSSICEAVLTCGADLGIIFDTDVDRAGCVDNTGKEINRNRLIALASIIALENDPNATIVTDSVTSDGLKTFIEDTLGGKHHRFKRGYRNVILEARRLNENGISCPLAIETSGHAALRDNYFLDDGAYLVTRIIIKFAHLRNDGMDLNSLISGLHQHPFDCELRLNITCPNFAEYGNSVITALRDFCTTTPRFTVATDSYEGVRVSFEDGWFLLRLSVHDPVMPMNFEASSLASAAAAASALVPLLSKFRDLDISPLTALIN